ncbi:MAG: winged helix-turn-helix domain-containing protein [Pseudoclavibacter sp.]
MSTATLLDRTAPTTNDNAGSGAPGDSRPGTARTGSVRTGTARTGSARSDNARTDNVTGIHIARERRVNATPNLPGARPLAGSHPNPSIPGAGIGASAPARQAPPAAGAPHPVAPGGAAPGAARTASAREARGFVLYVGLDEAKANLDETTLTRLVEALKRTTSEVAPHAETYAAVALAPKGTGGRDIDVVRLALGEPQALAEYYGTSQEQEQPTGVTIDTTRRRVLLGGENVGLTYKEFELLQALVLREGRTVDRAEIIDTLWRDAPDERPNDRTIDVHVRRLRSKLGPYADIVRTVRGTGYRFDRHADVDVLYSIAHSPDRF